MSTISPLLAANGSPSSKGERILMMCFQIIWQWFELKLVAGGRNVLGGLCPGKAVVIRLMFT